METQEGSTGTPDQQKPTNKIFPIRKVSAMSSQRWPITLANNPEFIVSKPQAHSVRQLLSFQASLLIDCRDGGASLGAAF
jgi:hypothetical protein